MGAADFKAKRKRPGRCPVCLGKLEKNARGTRYRNRCGSCRANLQKSLRCSSCGGHRIWRGPRGLACKGCGRSGETMGADWVIRDDLMTAHEVSRRVMASFPELVEVIEDDSDLVHMTFGALESFANRAIKDGDWASVKRAYDFVLDLALQKDQLHSEILNAIHLSFLEGLDFSNPRHGEKAKSLLPPILRQMWEDMMAHNKKIGWM